MKQRRVAVVAAVMVMVGVLAACQPSDVYTLASAKVGAKCTKVNAFAKNSTSVLVCSAKKRWVVKMPIAQAVNMINAYNRANTATSVAFRGRTVTDADWGFLDVPVAVTNADGNGVANAKVKLTSTSDQFLSSQSPVGTTDANGLAWIRILTGTTAGTKNLTATVVGTSVSATSDLVVRGGLAVTATAVSAASLPVSRGQITIKARVFDKYGNPSSGWFTLDGQLDFLDPQRSSSILQADADGYVNVVLGLVGRAGTTWIKLVEGDRALEIPLTLLPGPATTLTYAVPSQSTVPVSTSFADNLVTTVSDQYGNHVSGAGVAFSITPGTATASVGTPNAIADASGQASTSITCGPTPGYFTLNMQVAGVVTSFASITLHCAA